MKPPSDEEFLTPPSSKILIPQKSDFTKEFRIGWFDIDWNEHVNNVFLLKSIIESTPKDILQTHHVKELIYHIRSESFYDEKLMITGEVISDNLYSYKIVNSNSGKEIVYCTIDWDEFS